MATHLPIDFRFVVFVIAALLSAASVVSAGLLYYKARKSPKDSWAKEELERVAKAPSAAVRQRLTLRITDGLVARQSDDPSIMVILLNVRVDGEPATVRSWWLELEHAGKRKMAHQQIIIRNRVHYWFQGSVNEAPSGAVKEAVAISRYVPESGWLLFTIVAAEQEFDDYVFGATFLLTAFEDDSTQSSLTKPPGDWLHRANITYEGSQ